MDPQQRKLLEVVWEAFESGGITMEGIAGSTTACFIGSFTSDFQQMSFKEPDFRHSYAATGVDPGIISNRISHVFNLHGPSITVNTACSSSVYAIHNACNALRNKECSGAVVGGTNLVLTVDQHMNTAKLGVLSPDSTCHSFDESANGYGRAEAVGAVYLKRLADAVRDGDPIRGIIRSSAVNSNGKAPAVGITHPNKDGQEDVIRHAYRRGGNLDPRLTGYFECHGTGTAIGDPLEVHAVSKAMNDARSPEEDALVIGAVKANIGHSEAASGLSAIIKAVLVCEKGVIPPTRGVVNPNPKIDWENWQVRVNNEPIPFPEHLPVRRVSVNSFGYGGTNAHVIVEGVESFLPGYRHGGLKSKSRGMHNRKRPFLLPFCAHDRPTLNRNLAAYAAKVDKYNLLDLSYTLGNRRSRLASRGFTVVSDSNLQATFAGIEKSFTFADKKKAPTVAFAFTGQGAQWALMGAELMAYYPSFLKTIRKLDHALGELDDGPEWTIEDSLLENAETSRINEAEFSQPLCTAIQIALVELLACWAIFPQVTVGHSSGEIGAAFAAGKVSAGEAIIVAYYRGKVVRSVTTDGAMMAVGLGAEEVQPYLEKLSGKVLVACHNSPSLVTLSGDADALDSVKAELDLQGVFARPVKTGGKAYHSHHMHQVSAKYRALMQRTKALNPFESPKPSDAIMVSSVTNSVVGPDVAIDEDYWCANLVSPVLFNQAITTIATDPTLPKVDLLLEIGPHSALSGPIRQICLVNKFEKLSYLPTMLRSSNSAADLLKVAGELFLRDYPLDMDRVTLMEERKASGKIKLTRGKMLVDLPTYQWNYAKNLWAENRQSIEHRRPAFARHDILGQRIPGCSLAEPTWRNRLRIRDLPWLQHHSLGGEAVFPAAGYFSMAIEAITQMNEMRTNPVDIRSYVLRDVSIKNALVTPDDDDGIEVLFNLRPSVYDESGDVGVWWDFNVSSVSSEARGSDHMTGTIGLNARTRGQPPKVIPNLPQRASGKSWNQGLRDVGFDYGETFQDMANIRSDGRNFVAAAETALKKECGIMEGESRYVLHPSTVDSCLQLIIVSIYAGRLNDMTCGAVPIQVDEVAIFPPSSDQLRNVKATAHSWTDERGIRAFRSSSQLIAADGEMLMDIKDIRCVAYEAAVPLQTTELIDSQPFMEMVWKTDVESLDQRTGATMDIKELIALSVHKNPSLKVLEFGTLYARPALATSKLLDYTLACSTDNDLTDAKAVCVQYQNAKVQELNEVEPLQTQDLPEGKFDLVLAQTINGDASELESIRKTLVPGGRAVLGKVSEAALKAAGFTGVNFTMQDDVVVSTTKTETNEDDLADTNKNYVLVYRTKPVDLARQMQTTIAAMGWSVRSVSLASCEVTKDDRVVMVTDLEAPLLSTLSEAELDGLHHITTTTSSLLWITAGGLLTGKRPEHGMTAGLARSLTSENASLKLTTIDFDLDTTTSADVVRLTVAALQRQAGAAAIHESEYYVDKGVVHVSRLTPNQDLNQAYTLDKKDANDVFFSSGQALVGKVQSGRVVFEKDLRTDDPIDNNDVEVQVVLGGLNTEDVAVISGTDYPTDFSHEICGIVSKVGSEVKHLGAGDKVVGFSVDKFASIQRTSADLVFKLDQNDSLEEVTTLPMAYATALHGLQTLARADAHDTVLILNGTGSAGAAAIHVCKLLEAKTFVVVESPAEAQEMMAKFNLTMNQTLIALDGPIQAQIAALNESHSADVVFSAGSVDQKMARECWRGIAPQGRYVDVGRKKVLERSVLDTLPMRRGANYLSFDLTELISTKPKLISSLLRLSVQLYRDKWIPAIHPVKLENIAGLSAAISTFSNKLTDGKTLISYEASETPLQVLPSRTSFRFREDATYLLVGCLGGLGRSLTSWMRARGAKRFAFLSRSGTDSKQAAILVQDIEAAGIDCQVIRGDVTSQKDVADALKSIPSRFPVRGVVHAAMVLRVSLFP